MSFEKMHFPVFPLDTVIFPRERVHLPIFEPRYKQLLAECIEDSKTFGICTLFNGRVLGVGTEVKVTGVSFRDSDGSIDVQVKGMKRFEIKKYYLTASDKLYPIADIASYENPSDNFEELSDCLQNKIKELLRLNYLYFEIPKNRSGTISSFDIGYIIGLSRADKYDLLKEKSEVHRKLLIIKKLDGILSTLRNIEASKERVRYNGNYKIIISPDDKDKL